MLTQCGTQSPSIRPTNFAMNEQKQTKSIDRKIRRLMILIAFAHDFNFLSSLQCESLEKNSTEKMQYLSSEETFQMKFTCCCCCCQTNICLVRDEFLKNVTSSIALRAFINDVVSYLGVLNIVFFTDVFYERFLIFAF